MSSYGTAVVGIGRTAFTRKSGRTTLAMAVEAARAALDDAGLTPADVDGIIGYGINDTAMAQDVAFAVGVSDSLSYAQDIFGGGNIAAAIPPMAAAAVQTGAASVVVAFRSMNGRSGLRFGRLGGAGIDGPMQFNVPHGYAVATQFAAMWTQRHHATYGSTSEDLGAIAITQRTHATANEHAIARDPLDLETYLASRWITEPLRIYDCAYEADGAVAIVITSLERGRDLRQPPIRLVKSANAYGPGSSWDQWANLTQMWSAHAAPRFWSKTGLSPADIDVACIYDCYTYTVMTVLEDFGFYPKGQGGDFFRAGRATYSGDVVVNPHGGLLSEGYLHGMNHPYEAVLQLRGQAGRRQVAGATTALVTGGAGPYGGAVLYTKDV
jgi:acetyl-CoA acetyltransferase